MSKSSRKQLLRQEKEQAELIKRNEEKKKKRRELLIGGLCSLIVIVALGGTATVTILRNRYLDSGDALRKETAVTSENYTVDNAMMKYFIYSTYNYYLNYYGDNASYYGMDSTLDLKDQKYSEEQTWYDFCLQETRSSVQQMLVLCEGAVDEGIKLEDEELTTVEATLNNIKLSSYGRGVQKEDVRKCLEITSLATKYSEDMENNISISDDQINEYYDENKNSYTFANYFSYKLSFVDPDSDTETGISEEIAAAGAEAIKKATSVDEFKSLLGKYLTDNGIVSESDLEKTINAITETKLSYTKDSDLCEWAYNSERAVGNTFSLLDEDNNYYTVYILSSLPARSDYNVMDVRHILVKFDSYDTNDAAKSQADSILSNYNSGEKTEDAFAALAKKYSEDEGSASNGGLYENVYKGQMVAEFENWCFDESRKEGDVGIISSTYGYHIMYYVGMGEAKWKSDVRTQLESNAYDDKYNSLADKTSISFNDDAIAKIA